MPDQPASADPPASASRGITALAVNRPVSTLMACLMVALLGSVALSELAVDLMPNMRYPTVSVTTIYRGAAPAEAETLITRPLEEAISTVSGVEEISSTSAEGSSSIRVRLQWSRDVDAAVADIRQSIERFRKDLPDGVEIPQVRRYDVADRPILYLGLTSELSPIELTRMTEKQVLPQLLSLDGVARVSMRGAVRREIQVNLKRSELEARNMGVNEVLAALARENVTRPAGDMQEGNFKLLVRSRGEFASLEEIETTVVRTTAGATVRIADIAQVVDGEEERTELTRTNGKPGLMVYVYKQSGANTVQVADSVRKAVARLNASLTQGQLTIRFDQSDYIRQSIDNVRQAAVYGIGLAVLVLIVFLRSFRSTLTIAVSIPLAMLATFALIYFMGFTLNLISFGGLALGIGLLVDNSIVVLESIFRKRADGRNRYQAAIEGTREVSGAIVASTLTTLVVFVPLLFIDGMTGLMLHQLAWVVSMSLLCSLFASLTLTPVLTTLWKVDPENLPGDAAADTRLGRWVRRIHAANAHAFTRIEAGYERLLRASLRNGPAVGITLFAIFCVTMGLLPRVGTEFLPQTDEGDLDIDCRMAAGIQLETLDRQSKLVENMLLTRVPETQVLTSFIGDDADDGDEWNRSRFRIRLPRRSERERGVEEIRTDLAKQLSNIPGMEVRVRTRNELSRYRFVNSGGGAIRVEVRGHDLQTAETLARQLAKRLENIRGLVNIEVGQSERRPMLAAAIDRAKANLLGISVQDITQALETAVRGTEATVFHDEDDEFNVLVRLQETDRNHRDDIEQIGVSTPTGQIVPLKNLVRFDAGNDALAIRRLDQQRLVSVTADVSERDLGSVVREVEQELRATPRPNDFTLRISGDWEEQQESFAALLQGFVLALLLMYMIMAAQFESLRDPVLVMIAVPLGGVGVVLTLLATSTTLNVQSFIGLVVLAGIVVNNAIVLVDYMKQLDQSEPDVPPSDRVVKAAVRRLRPILMTTITTVLAMLPIAFGAGEGGELQAPLARVVIGGLTSGTLITLLAIPLIYDAVYGRRALAGKADSVEAELPAEAAV